MHRALVATFVIASALIGCKRNNAGGAAATPPPAAGGGGGLGIGATASGTLAATDNHLQDGSVADDFQMNLTAGQPVTIVVRGGPSVSEPGSNLDVYAIIMQNNAEVTHDDDSAGNLNSRIVFTPPTTGQYVLRVTTFGGGLHQGAYTIQTMAGANPNAS